MRLNTIQRKKARGAFDPNPDIEIVIASETKQSRPFAMRLPRTLRVLAMTDCEKVFVF